MLFIPDVNHTGFKRLSWSSRRKTREISLQVEFRLKKVKFLNRDRAGGDSTARPT